jgi:hypothetical protein
MDLILDNNLEEYRDGLASGQIKRPTMNNHGVGAGGGVSDMTPPSSLPDYAALLMGRGD